MEKKLVTQHFTIHTWNNCSIKNWLIILVCVSVSFFAFSSSINANEKILQFRLGGIQSKIGTNFAELIAPKNQRPIFPNVDKKFQKNFSEITSHRNNIAFLFFDGEKLAAEKYNHNADSSTPLFLYSITKSVTGLMLLQEICQRSDITLDDTIGLYSDRLEETVYGEVSIRNALKMQSGVGEDFFKNTQKQMFISFLRLEKTPLDWIKGIADKKPEGQHFWYNANDTNAVGVLLEDLSGKSIVDNFSEKFVHLSRVSSSVYWQQAKNGEAIGAYGLMATPRDAISLAVKYLEILDTNKCVESHFNQMFKADKSDGKYGFQVWRHQTIETSDTSKFYMAGHGGQYLIMNRNSGSVAFIYSVFRDYSSKPVIDIFYKTLNRLL